MLSSYLSQSVSSLVLKTSEAERSERERTVVCLECYCQASQYQLGRENLTLAKKRTDLGKGRLKVVMWPYQKTCFSASSPRASRSTTYNTIFITFTFWSLIKTGQQKNVRPSFLNPYNEVGTDELSFYSSPADRSLSPIRRFCSTLTIGGIGIPQVSVPTIIYMQSLSLSISTFSRLLLALLQQEIVPLQGRVVSERVCGSKRDETTREPLRPSPFSPPFRLFSISSRPNSTRRSLYSHSPYISQIALSLKPFTLNFRPSLYLSLPALHFLLLQGS